MLKLQNYKNSRNEDGVALMTTLITAMIVIMLVLGLTAMAFASVSSQKDTQSNSGMNATLSSAVSNAVSMANNPLAGESILNHLGESNKAIGGIDSEGFASNTGDYKWEWWLEQGVNNSYVVVARAYDDSNGKDATSRTNLQPIPVDSAKYKDDGSIVYSPTSLGVFTWGMFGSGNVTLGDNVKVKSFDSSSTPNAPTSSTGFGLIASNGGIVTSKSDAGDTNVFFNSNGTSSDRFDESAIENVQDYDYSINLDGVKGKVAEKCPLEASAYPNWRSSGHGGVLNNDSGECYNNLVFDSNTELSIANNSNNAINVYALGDVSFNSGVKVNQSVLSGGSTALRIFASGGNNVNFNNGTTGNPTVVNALIAGESHTCSDTVGGFESLVFRGSLACSNISMGGSTTLWWDEATHKSVSEDLGLGKNVVWIPVSAR